MFTFQPRIASLAVATLLLCGAPATAGTMHVPSEEFPTIQSAVDAAQAGDVILVAPGTYRENIVVTTSDLSLETKSAVIDGGYAGSCIAVTADNVTVSGFRLVNGGESDPAPDGEATLGGLLYTGAGAVIIRNEVLAAGGFGIRLQGSGTIEQNSVAGCTAEGIEVDGEAVAEAPLTTIELNDVSKNGAGILAEQGSYTIEKNACLNNDGHGIQLLVADPSEGTVVPPASTIRKNTCQGNSEAGITVDDPLASGLTLDKNTVNGNGLGIVVDGLSVTVTGNTVEHNRHGGLMLFLSSGAVSKNKVLRNAAFGILIAAPSELGSPTGSNAVSQNSVKTSAGDGIVLVASPTSTIEGNTVNENLGDGISIGPADNTDVDVLANKLSANGHDGIDNSGTNTLISDNTVKKSVGNDLAGIGDGTGTVDAASTGNVFTSGGLDQASLLELTTFTL